MTINSFDRSIIEAYLRKTFRKQERGFLARLCGEAREYSYHVNAVEDHCASLDVTQSSLVWVSVKESYLDRARLPSAESWGLFALSNSVCVHLNHRHPGNFTKVLQKEGSVKDISAASLATLFSDAVLSEKRRWVTVLTDSSSVTECETRGYAMDDERRQEFAEIFFPPMKTDGREATTVEFFSLVGSALSNQSLVRILLTIFPDGNFRFETNLIFEYFFSRIPYRRMKSEHNLTVM